MALTVQLAVVGLLLTAVPVWAADASAEIDFVGRASIGNLFVIEESRLAIQKAEAPALKAFAERMVDEHQKAETALAPATEGSGATVATALDAPHQTRMAALQGKSGTDFDKSYAADQGEAHSNALTLYADYMLLGDNAKLKALAIKMIPITQAQLKAAQALSQP